MYASQNKSISGLVETGSMILLQLKEVMLERFLFVSLFFAQQSSAPFTSRHGTLDSSPMLNSGCGEEALYIAAPQGRY